MTFHHFEEFSAGYPVCHWEAPGSRPGMSLVCSSAVSGEDPALVLVEISLGHPPENMFGERKQEVIL